MACTAVGVPPAQFVYLLQSLSDPSQFYSGLTTDVTARLTAHNEGRSRHTSRHRPWRVLAAIEFVDEATAIRFEKYLKSGSGRAFARKHFRPAI
jgi:predicted GIY-YIG superfamily endonuclease